MIKLIATDLDGTLADHKGKIPEGVFEVIEKLYKKGIIFVVATGRQTTTVENDFRRVLDKIYVITENGGVIRHKERDIYVDCLPGDKVEEAVQHVSQIPGMEFVVCCKDCAYQNTDTEAFHQELDKYYHSRAPFKSIEPIREQVIKIALYDKEDITRTTKPHIEDVFDGKFKLTISGIHWLDMGGLHVNKGNALKKLMDELNLKADECMAFGDYFNDVEMLEQVTHSYAMEHAPEGVKCHAVHIAPANGVLDIIESVIK